MDTRVSDTVQIVLIKYVGTFCMENIFFVISLIETSII